MRELFVYYRVRVADTAAVQAAAQAMQAQLRAQHPGLIARLMRRADVPATNETWMETYAVDPAHAADGVNAALEAAIDRAAIALQPLLAGPRHTEVFIACAS